MTKEMKGYCFLFSETGTEGGWWAMQEDGFKAEDGVHELRDDEAYEEKKDQEDREKAQLSKVSDRWDDVAEFVEKGDDE